MTRENPVWRERDRYVLEANNLIDKMVEIRIRMRERKSVPVFLTDNMAHRIRQAESLIQPLMAYRDQVPREIED